MYISTISKVLVLLGVGIGKFLIGVVPAYSIKRSENERKGIIISVLLCFGAGILLEQSPFFGGHGSTTLQSIISGGGFFLLYLGNEIYDCVKKTSIIPGKIFKLNVETSPGNENAAAPENSRREEESFLPHKTAFDSKSNSCVSHLGLILALMILAGEGALWDVGGGGRSVRIDNFAFVEPIIALSQLVTAFWLGLELSEAYGTGYKHILGILLYSSAPILSFFIRMLWGDCADWQSRSTKSCEYRFYVMITLDFAARGMLVYVAFMEILSREQARWKNSPIRWTGLLQFFSVLGGFIFINTTCYFIATNSGLF